MSIPRREGSMRSFYSGSCSLRASFFAAFLVVLYALAPNASAAVAEPGSVLARQQLPLLLDPLKDLVAIESGSSDIEGLDKIRGVLAARLGALGAKVDTIAPEAPAKGVGIPDRI